MERAWRVPCSAVQAIFVTAAITTTVVMVVAAISPQHAWQQPVFRLADTVIGVAVGALAAWADIQAARHD